MISFVGTVRLLSSALVDFKYIWHDLNSPRVSSDCRTKSFVRRFLNGHYEDFWETMVRNEKHMTNMAILGFSPLIYCDLSSECVAVV